MADTQPPTVLVAEEQFTFDRGVLARSLGADSDEDPRGQVGFGDAPADQIAGAVSHAEVSGALKTPVAVALYVIPATPDSVMLTVRETHEVAAPRRQARAELGLPDERQLASWEIESGWLTDGHVDTFGALCDTLQEVCRVANGLLPSLQALLDGEQRLIDLAEEPLTVITYTNRGRLTTYPVALDDLTEHDSERTKNLWPHLLDALEGEGGRGLGRRPSAQDARSCRRREVPRTPTHRPPHRAHRGGHRRGG
jgi:hypothetical protein